MTLELEQIPKSEAGAAGGDPFGSVGPKIGALLQLARESPVALIGGALPDWVDELSGHFGSARRLRSVEELVGPGDPELIVWMPGAGEGAELAADLAAVRRALAPTGTLLLLAPNRFALRRMRREPFDVLRGGLRSRRGYRSLLAAADFSRIHSYLPLPDLWRPEEFVTPGSDGLSLPDASRIERALHTSGVYPHFHDSFLYLASGEAGGAAPFLTALSRGLGSGGALLLDRFAMRRRGALVLLLREAARGGRRLAVRVTTDATVEEVVGENRRWTAAIHSHPAMPASVRELVPAPCGDLDLEGNRVRAETLLEGTIGWRVAGDPRLEPPLFLSVQAFARDFAVATRSQRALDPDAVAELLPRLDYPWLAADYAGELEALRSLLREHALGTTRTLAWAHGDFGYGNVLADPRSGRLTGVIDWDQAREDLAGVDLLNLLLQRARGAGSDPAERLRDFARRFLAGGFRGIDRRIDFEDAVPVPAPSRAGLLAWTVWRFLERDLRYPAAAEKGDDLRPMLQWALELLTEQGNGRS